MLIAREVCTWIPGTEPGARKASDIELGHVWAPTVNYVASLAQKDRDVLSTAGEDGAGGVGVVGAAERAAWASCKDWIHDLVALNPPVSTTAIESGPVLLPLGQGVVVLSEYPNLAAVFGPFIHYFNCMWEASLCPARRSFSPECRIGTDRS